MSKAVKWALRRLGAKISTATPPSALRQIFEAESKQRDAEAVGRGCRIAFEIHGAHGERSWRDWMGEDEASLGHGWCDERRGVLETAYGRRWYFPWPPWIRVSGMEGRPEDFEIGAIYEAKPGVYFRRLF